MIIYAKPGKRGLTPASPLGEEPKPDADFIMFKINGTGGI